MKPFSLYLHIPFCLHKCPYCDFNTYAVSKAPEDEYVSALLSELDFRAQQEEWKGRTIQSIYFGGGTPSLFHPRSFKRLIFYICRIFPVDSRVEITIEVNPGTVTTENMAGYRSVGINRISLGAQTFNSALLKTLGRIHTPEQTMTAVSAARQADFRNISLDLIYGLPGQTLPDFRRDLRDALALSPEHLSAYGLTFEKGTEFYVQYRKGKLKPPHEDIILEMMSEMGTQLKHHGFSHYEISNYAKPNREARHNMAYWNGDDYLGLGAGAHSMVTVSANERRRWSNAALPKQYIERTTSAGRADSWSDSLGLKELLFEFFFLGLRKLNGISLRDFHTRFGFSAQSAYPGIIEVLVEKGFLRHENEIIALTEKGFFVADSVIENFIYDKRDLPAPEELAPAPELPNDLPQAANC